MGDFVNLNISKKLKEKGFEWIKIATYNPKTKVRNNHLEPTISQVLKWLREEKKLYVGVTLHQYLDKSKFYPTIQRMDKMEQIMFANNDVYSFYEEAALAGIEYAIDNLI